MKTMLALILLTLAGCASIQHAGTASYTLKRTTLPDNTVIDEIALYNGKELAQLHAHFEKHGADYMLDLQETGVQAFEGQRVAAGVAAEAAKVAVTAVTAAGAVLIAPVALPAIGALVAAPGIVPAAAGVGAGVLLNKATTP